MRLVIQFRNFLFIILIIQHVSFAKATGSDSIMIRKIFSYALSKGEGFQNLNELCTRIGNRLSGSPHADEAVSWARKLMESYEFDTVYLQNIMVPHWERGLTEKAYIEFPERYRNLDLHVIGIGNTIGTGPAGVQANVMEVDSFEQLDQAGYKKIHGKIVFFNQPMDPTLINTFQAYSNAASQRYHGPEFASRYGAKGVIVRSLTTRLDDVPHTGATAFMQNEHPIPAIAISTNDAEKLSAILKTGSELKIHFITSSSMKEDKPSFNVIGEIRGSEFPGQYILIGAHLDSWDVGQGAHDDGAGCVHALEALRILQCLGYKPRHSLRVVLFMNEENGLRGGKAYAGLVGENKEKHIAAIESDSGGFTPKGFTINASDVNLHNLKAFLPYFAPYGIHEFVEGEGGADISPMKKFGVPLIGFKPDSQRYFKYHHSYLDTFDKVDKRELELGSASITSLVYLIDQYGL